ncbi:hypothetical protein F5877DRAFT_68038 [Lentinula edodes]|nr:hypothetical protein F5877DRAFT_68038 [Lentinula edodes]
MDPDKVTDDGTYDLKPHRLGWYRRENHDYYCYAVDDDGIVQKIIDIPNAEEVSPRVRAKTPPPQKGALKRRDERTSGPGSVAAAEVREATPVTFKFSAAAPKYFLDKSKRTNSIVGDTYGPTKLQTVSFRSHTSEGETAWYYSQSPVDLDVPLPETPIPRILGTIYIHRSTKDGGYQIWVWFNRDGKGLGWQPVDLNNEQVAHPKIADRSLKLTATGKPSWVLNSTLTTYRSRSLKRSGSRPVEDSGSTPSAYPQVPILPDHDGWYRPTEAESSALDANNQIDSSSRESRSVGSKDGTEDNLKMDKEDRSNEMEDIDEGDAERHNLMLLSSTEQNATTPVLDIPVTPVSNEVCDQGGNQHIHAILASNEASKEVCNQGENDVDQGNRAEDKPGLPAPHMNLLDLISTLEDRNYVSSSTTDWFWAEIRGLGFSDLLSTWSSSSVLLSALPLCGQ